MNQGLRMAMGLAVAFLLVVGNAWALDFGDNITIYDKNKSASSGWYGPDEDQEVEPGMVTGQKWDLEGFFIDGWSLTMIGGFNFKMGERGSKLFESGDIFLDVDSPSNAIYGDIHTGSNGYHTVSNTYGYDYVIDLDFASMEYDVYEIDENDLVETTYYSQNQGSSPYRYVKAADALSIFSGTIGYQTNLSDTQTGFLGGSHNAVTVDLSFLGFNQTFISHFTMGCGNDNLMGAGTTPTPEPGTMALLGIGLVGLVAAGRKRAMKV